MDILLAKIGISAVMLPMAVVSYVIGFVASWFVTLGGTLTNWALSMNSSVLTSITVKTGWIVSRDLANLGFVLAIILIAFITILRYQSYDTKKMLVRLISAALLINFSLVIAGVFIDFSGMLTNFFLSKATSGHIEQIGPGLVGSLRAHELFQQKADEGTIKNQIEGMGGDFNKFIVFLATQTFIAIFTTITAISLLSLAAMLLIRYLALTILLILMPIAWLMWIWPDLEGYWGQWWKEFMKWCFFAPSMSFFIYLAFQVALTYKSTSGSWVGAPVDGVGDMGILIQNFSSILGQMISVLGILYGGLLAASKMGIAGASIGISAVGIAKGYITGAPGATGGYIGRAISDRIRTAGYQEGKGGVIQRASAGLTGSWVIGGAARAVNQWATAGGKDLVGNYEKEYASLANDETAFLNFSKSTTIAMDIARNPAKAAAYINVAAEKGMLGKVREKNPAIFDGLIKASREMGTASKIFSRNPTLAGLGLPKDRAEEEIKKWVGKTSVADILNLSAEDLFNAAEANKTDSNYRPTVLLNLTKPQLKKLSQEARGGQIDAINAGLQAIEKMIIEGKLNNLSPNETRTLEALRGWDETIVAQTAKPSKSNIITPGQPGFEEEFRKNKGR